MSDETRACEGEIWTYVGPVYRDDVTPLYEPNKIVMRDPEGLLQCDGRSQGGVVMVGGLNEAVDHWPLVGENQQGNDLRGCTGVWSADRRLPRM